MPEQHFFIEGQYFGKALRGPYTDTSGVTYWPGSNAWFCPLCGDVWARACVEGATFTTITAVCRKHPATSNGPYDRRFPGTLWKPYLGRLLEAFPEEVLQRELSLHLDYAESKLV